MHKKLQSNKNDDTIENKVDTIKNKSDDTTENKVDITNKIIFELYEKLSDNDKKNKFKTYIRQIEKIKDIIFKEIKINKIKKNDDDNEIKNLTKKLNIKLDYSELNKKLESNKSDDTTKNKADTIELVQNIENLNNLINVLIKIKNEKNPIKRVIIPNNDETKDKNLNKYEIKIITNAAKKNNQTFDEYIAELNEHIPDDSKKIVFETEKPKSLTPAKQNLLINLIKKYNNLTDDEKKENTIEKYLLNSEAKNVKDDEIRYLISNLPPNVRGGNRKTRRRPKKVCRRKTRRTNHK